MALPNPTINPPQFERPNYERPVSRSPSSSPVRHARNFSHDPILRNLSPNSTLRALNAASGPDTSKSEDQLVKSIEHASTSDRAFGVRVAQTCRDLKSWVAEIETWDWPGTFEPPPIEERTAKRRRMLSEIGTLPIDSNGRQMDDTGGFWGSLPMEIIQDHEARIDDISAAVDELNIEGLKEHVRSVHMQPRTSYDPLQQEDAMSQLKRMDDFTALVTGTILQALPYLSYLNRLLSEWSIRLTVMRKVPGFLRGLEDVRISIDGGWDDMMIESQRSEEVAGPLRNRFEVIQAGLGAKVTALGQRLDSMLDDLEGRHETLPEKYIDRFEELESSYSDWVVQGERMIEGLTFERLDQSTRRDQTVLAAFDALGPSSATFSQGTETSTMQPLVSPLDEKDDYFGSHPDMPEHSISPSDSVRRDRVESPVLGKKPFEFFDHDEPVELLHDQARGRQESVRPRQDSTFNRLVDDVIVESLEQPQESQDEDDSIGIALGHGHASPYGATLRTISSHQSSASPTRMSFSHPRSPTRISFSHPRSPTKQSVSPSRSSTSSRNRSRHTPIDIGPYREASLSPKRKSPSPDRAFSHQPTPPLSKVNEEPHASSVQAKKALFGGDLERKQLLLKAKTPPIVRPFERASTAFTKLFDNAANRNNSASKGHSKSNSGVSRKSSLRHAITPSSIRNSSSSKRTSDNSFGDLPSSSDRGSKDDSNLEVAEIISNRTNSTSLPIQRHSQIESSKPDWSDKELAVSGRPEEHVFEQRQFRDVEYTQKEEKTSTPRFDSPLMQQDVNWPLPARVPVDVEELSSPGHALQSDYFEKFFVDSLPLSPGKVQALDQEVNPMEVAFGATTRQPLGPNEPSMDSSMLDGVFNHTIEDMRSAKVAGTKRRSRSAVPYKPVTEDFLPSLSDIGTPASTQSTPEIGHASSVGYFQAKKVQTPGHSRSHSTDDKPRKRSSVSPLNSFNLQMPSGAQPLSPNGGSSKQKTQRMPMEKRASKASIELFARSEVSINRVDQLICMY